MSKHCPRKVSTEKRGKLQAVKDKKTNRHNLFPEKQEAMQWLRSPSDIDEALDRSLQMYRNMPECEQKRQFGGVIRDSVRTYSDMVEMHMVRYREVVAEMERDGQKAEEPKVADDPQVYKFVSSTFADMVMDIAVQAQHLFQAHMDAHEHHLLSPQIIQQYQTLCLIDLIDPSHETMVKNLSVAFDVLRYSWTLLNLVNKQQFKFR